MYNLNNAVARRSWGFSELLRPFVLATSFRIPITLQRKLPTNLIKIFNSYSTCGRYNLGRYGRAGGSHTLLHCKLSKKI